MSRLLRRLAAITARSRFEAEMREELRSHIEHRIDDLIAAGLSRDDATRQARVEFGALEAYKEQCRDSRGFVPARITLGLWGDFKMAARRLRAAPVFLAFAVLSLAAGIGVTTTSYGVIESLFWRPLGVPDASGVGMVTESRPDASHRVLVSRQDFNEIVAARRTLTSIAASARFRQTLVAEGSSESVSGEAVTGEYFRLLRIGAALGRTIQPSDDNGATPVVVLSHSLWRKQFGADPAIVGRIVRLGGHPFEIVGVASPTFYGIYRRTPAVAWVPLGAASLFADATALAARDMRDLSVVGRLSPDHTIAAAAAEFASIGRRLDETSPIQRAAYPGAPAFHAPRPWTVLPIDVVDLPPSEFPLLLLVIVSMVLLVACTNLANLMLARGTIRQHEFAVRRALGASRWRLIREQCAESVIVTVLGGIAAVAFTRWLIVVVPDIVPGLRSDLPVEPALSASVLLVAAGALLVSLLAFGLEPAIQLTRTAVRADLAAASGSVGVPRARRQRTIIRWQVAICTCFFIIATIFSRVIIDEARHDSGVDLDRLAVATVDGTAGWDEARVRRAVADALAAARQQPGIEEVAVSAGLPFGIRASYAALTTLDKPFEEERAYTSNESRGASYIPATSDIFRTLGIPILAGRGLNDGDGAASAPVAVVSVRAARDLFGVRDVVGRQMMLKLGRRPSRTVTIVGVIQDTDASMMGVRPGGHVYVPFSQDYMPIVTMSARTSGDPAIAARNLQAAIRIADPDLSVPSYGDGWSMLGGMYGAAYTALIGSAALGALTLLLAMVGLYGVQSQGVSLRTREVGVRVALGATARQIERMVLAEGYIPVAQGLVLGLILGSVSRLALRTLFEAPIDLVDPLALLVVPPPLALAAFLACRLPASRAARVDPMTALRHL